MRQQFNDEVAQVAGNDVINHQITNYFNITITAPIRTDHEARTSLIHLLLRKGELAGIRCMLENISFKLYGSRYFKSLTLEQLIILHGIADEVVEVLYRSRGRYAVAAKSVSDLLTV